MQIIKKIVDSSSMTKCQHKDTYLTQIISIILIEHKIRVTIVLNIDFTLNYH